MQKKKQPNKNPMLKAGVFSKLFFWWTRPTFIKGKSHDLTIADFYDVPESDQSEKLGAKLENHWKETYDVAIRRDEIAKFFNAIVKRFGYKYFEHGLFMILLNLLRIGQPYLLGLLLSYFEPDTKVDQRFAYLYASGLIVVSLAHSIMKHHVDLMTLRLGMRLRIACSSLIYRKLLRLSLLEAEKIEEGKLVNLLTNDVSKFDPVFMYLHYIWISPLVTAIIIFLIYLETATATFFGIICLLLFTVPSQVLVTHIARSRRKKIAEKTDERIQLMSQIIKGIQVIKMYTWEKPFGILVQLARRDEIRLIRGNAIFRGLLIVFNAFVDRICLFITLAIYVYYGNFINATSVYSLVQYFTILQNLTAYNYPRAILNLNDALISCKRIKEFLLRDDATVTAPYLSVEENGTIKLRDVSASWVQAIAKTVYRINMDICKQGLNAIIGPSGSGKTSVMHVILRELQQTDGHVEVNGTIAYVSQKPWLFPGTVRENILFDEKYNEERFREVLRVCALTHEVARLPHGENTQVGERGTNLSGGQCARINLARAVYKDADIYLLDDTFASLDTTVAKYIFEECLIKYLGNKTRVFVTHRYKFIQHAQRIFLMMNGRIDSSGLPESFGRDRLKFMNISEEEEIEEQQNRALFGNQDHDNPDLIIEDNIRNIEEDELLEPDEREELIAKGKMKTSILKKYFWSGNTCWFIYTTVILFIIAQMARSGSDYLLAHWTYEENLRMQENQIVPVLNSSIIYDQTTVKTTTSPNNISEFINPNNETVKTVHLLQRNGTNANESSHSSINSEEESSFPLLPIYGALLILCCIAALLKSYCFYELSMNSNKYIHNAMFSRVLGAPITFFDKQNSGQILNRFSKDTGTMDEVLPHTMFESIEVFSIILGAMVQILVVNWWSFLPIILVGFLYWKIREFYVPTSYRIRRLEGAAKSPVLAHLVSTLDGLSTIRSSRGQKVVNQWFDKKQDVHTSACFENIATATAFGLWLDVVSNLLVACVVIGSVLVKSSFVGGVGLAITQSLMLCGMLQRGIRQTAEAFSQMTCVERILQYTNLERENFEEGNKPGDHWPTNGKIEFRNVTLRYSKDDDPVLKNLNFIIEGKSKVGIVGRTGEGKSSLIAALFRMINTKGQILIDDVDIRKMVLPDLRKNLSIIPQEPIIFSATLQNNLDPLKKFDEKAIKNTLETVGLQNRCERLDKRIDRNFFSSGELQLFCLVRALIKKSQILILDEAMANLDPTTASFTDQVIKERYSDCTVIKVAHRLESVIESEKVIVLKNGEIVEYDHPYQLLRNERGHFYKMAKQCGQAVLDQFKTRALQEYERIRSLERHSNYQERTESNLCMGLEKAELFVEDERASIHYSPEKKVYKSLTIENLLTNGANRGQEQAVVHENGECSSGNNCENFENVQNVENQGNVKNGVNIENVEKIEKLDNAEDFENIEQTKNSQNIVEVDSPGNIEQVRNVKNSEGIEHTGNSENTKNVKYIKNTDIAAIQL